MKLYCVQYDGEQDYIEAANMGAAIALWVEFNRVQREFDGTEEPESCALVHESAVIRAARPEVDLTADGWRRAARTSKKVEDEPQVTEAFELRAPFVAVLCVVAFIAFLIWAL